MLAHRSSCLRKIPQFLILKTCKRHITAPKKFFKNVNIVGNEEGMFEICLDKKKLKTPQGNVFRVPSESLALAVATEWNSQQGTINRSTMHLTGLCNTALDNPMKYDSSSLSEIILKYLESDTICFRASEPQELFEFQQKEWDPVIKWFQNRYNATINVTRNICGPEVPLETKNALKRYLASHNFWALSGFYFAVEAIKSILLVLAAAERYLTIEESVSLSRLETQFQINHWGNVEWAHDIDLMDTRARVAAAILFIHLNSEGNTILSRRA